MTREEFLYSITYLEPTLPDNSSEPTLIDVTYLVGSKWITHHSLDTWLAWFLVKTCVYLNRPVRAKIAQPEPGPAVGTLLALLNLFYNTLSDRNRQVSRKSSES